VVAVAPDKLLWSAPVVGDVLALTLPPVDVLCPMVPVELDWSVPARFPMVVELLGLLLDELCS